MNLLISASDLKTFYSALQCLGRISDTVWLQCSPRSNGQTQVCLSAMSSTNSAYCKFTFDPDFFLSVSTHSHSQIECQIQLKTVLSILRARGRTVERCELELVDEGPECRFSIKLHCQHGILKLHKLTYEPRKAVSPVGDLYSAPNHFTINAQTAQEWTEHFLSSSKNGDITFFCTPDSCVAKSKEEDIAEGKGQIRRAIHTEVRIMMDNFREYRVTDERLLTFSLKEFKAAVTLAETLQVPLEIRFSDGDDPLFIRLKLDSAVVADFVVATSKGERMSSNSAAPISTRPASKERPGTAEADGQRHRQGSPPSTQDHSLSRGSMTKIGSVAPETRPVESTPNNNADGAAYQSDDEETVPLFFPGASQDPALQLEFQAAADDSSDASGEFSRNAEAVPPTPLSRGGDPQEFASAALHSQTTSSQVSDNEHNLERTGQRKRFQPLF